MEFFCWLPMKVRVAAAFFAVGVIWGSAWIAETQLSQIQPEMTAYLAAGCGVGALRFGLAAMVLAGAALVIRLATRAGRAGGYESAESKRNPVLRRRWLWGSVLTGVTLLGLPYALTVWGAGRVSAGMVALCFGLMPLAIVLFEDEAREGAIPRTALGIGGVAMIVAPGLSLAWHQVYGAGALLAAMVFSGISMIYLRRLQAETLSEGFDPILAGRLTAWASIQCGTASLLLAVLAGCGWMMSGRDGFALRSPFLLSGAAALQLAILAIVVSAGTLPLLLWLLGRLPAWQVSTLQWVSTLIAVAEGAWFVHARPTAEGWIGAVLLAGCTVSVLRRGWDGPALPVSWMPAAEADGVTGKITVQTSGMGKASD